MPTTRSRLEKYKDSSWMHEKYHTEGLSTTQIGNMFGLKACTVLYWLKKHGIATRTKSEALSGNRNPSYGKPVSEETREKLSKAGLGRKHKLESRKAISDFHKGKPKSTETRRKLSLAAYKRFEIKENHPRWKKPEDRITPVYNQIRNAKEYIEWRTKVFERDKYTCTNCGDKSGGNLNADHVISFAYLIHKNQIKTLEQALQCRDIWDVNNGQTLCVVCHRNTPSYRKKIAFLKKLYD